MLNSVNIIGRLTADPELKTTKNEIHVCSFTVANDTGYGDRKQTNFIQIVAWKGQADVVSKYCRKGSLVGISGSLRSRKYTDKDGKNHTVYEVVCTELQLLDSRRDTPDTETETKTEKASETVQEQFEDMQMSDDLPF